ncbi:MAG TPA: AMP-binding protein [Acidobacteriaceae bacterium]|nr:AMP-binding protein [Acidobacteriaceae bacterium]
MRFPDSDLPLQRIYSSERHRPDQPFLTQPRNGEVQSWTWAEAMHEIRRIARWLIDQNWPAGSRVAILSKNCAWWIMADIAIWMSGHVSVPFFPSLRNESLSLLFQHSEPVACFVGELDQSPSFGAPSLRNMKLVRFPNAKPDHIPSDSEEWQTIVQNGKDFDGQPLRAAEEVATIIYTSGTTGQPKGVMQSFRSLSLMGKSMEPVLGNSPYALDRILSYLPLAHIAERAIVEMNSLMMPLQIFFTEGQQTFLTDLQRSKCTIFFSIPRLYLRFQQGVFEKVPERKLQRLLKIPILNRIARSKILNGLGLHHARLVASGGAAIPIELVHWYRKLGLNFVEGYGMTETGITHVPLPSKFRAGFVGNASPYADTRISSQGEVEIKGPMNMLGYYKNPELTQQAFTEDGYFRTGDRGEIDEQGRLRIVGRLKEEFKTAKGKYVVPAPIEKLLSLSTLFESVCVLGSGMSAPFSLAVLVPELRAAAESPTKREALETALKHEMDRVNSHLDQHEQLRFMVVCQQPWTADNGLLTPTLKVRRTALEERFDSSFLAWEQAKTRVLWQDAIAQ